ncbi:MAG: hypothetical protein UW58_C0048G0007 [Candidatus Collierbacteria bacterium GW2011_GWC2_44_30]|nr:MAG: hypothetical protein UW58_C0048G0007 [Candidatus Collierbacteria bacterium GW2011_GWC2_44_30]
MAIGLGKDTLNGRRKITVSVKNRDNYRDEWLVSSVSHVSYNSTNVRKSQGWGGFGQKKAPPEIREGRNGEEDGGDGYSPTFSQAQPDRLVCHSAWTGTVRPASVV